MPRVQLPLRRVPCLDCKAAVGEPCRSAPGRVLSSGHRVRRVHAARLLAKERAAAGEA